MHHFGHGNAESLVALIQALRLAGAACVLISEELHRLPHATHKSRFDGASGHGKEKNNYTPR
jgi:divalent metal cation (Fe/Co/Zn/Cd) transporter